jgi:hypothetical protein
VSLGPKQRGLARSYASASTDTGHEASDPNWGANRAKEIDYGHRGTHALRRRARTHSFDMLTVLENWVEKGTPPGPIVATHAAGGTVDRTRPICPHPQLARCNGQAASTTRRALPAAGFTCCRRAAT